MSKARATIKLVPILTACLLVQGCFGIVVARKKTETPKNPFIGYSPAIYNVDSHGSTNRPIATAVWLQEHWGTPTRVRLVSTDPKVEQRIYKFGLIWYGIMPSFVVPIPLILPFSKEKVIFYVREGEVVRVDVVKNHATGVMYAPIGPDAYPCSYAEW
jgi:hypothetical protein